MDVVISRAVVRGGKATLRRDVITAPAVLERPTRQESEGVWAIPIRGEPNASIDIVVNDAVVTVTLDDAGEGEIALAADAPIRYMVSVEGAPEIAPSVPLPMCTAIVEVV